jgi:hypothetical protein
MLEIHIRIASELSNLDWSLIDQITFEKATRVAEDSKDRQIRKFARLLRKQYPTKKTSKETVINLSDQTLDDGISLLLQKGLNYSVIPRTIPIEGILAGIEKAVLSLPFEMAEEARQETVRIIKSSSKPRSNITTAESKLLRTLKNNTDLTILPADKAMLQLFSTLLTTNRRSPLFLKAQTIED